MRDPYKLWLEEHWPHLAVVAVMAALAIFVHNVAEPSVSWWWAIVFVVGGVYALLMTVWGLYLVGALIWNYGMYVWTEGRDLTEEYEHRPPRTPE